jgi:transposase-like protein
MKQRRKFSIELKRQVVEEVLSGVSTPAQLMRRHDISSGLLYHWKEQYARGREVGQFLKAAIAMQNIAAFMDRLEEIGRISMETRPLPFRTGMWPSA